MNIGYLHIAPKHCWRKGDFVAHLKTWKLFYIFRNPPGVIKWIPGQILPRRWGFGFFGLIEFGDRG